MHKIHRIRLTPEERQQLESRCRKGSLRADWHRSATVLLLADENRPGGPCRDADIALAIHAHVRTVERIRERAVMGGLDAVLTRKPHPNPKPRKLDGKAEAVLVALCCSEPPEGRASWTMQLLADKIVELKIVDAIGPECVRRTLKKTLSSHGKTPSGASRPKRMPRLSARWRT
jgi:hypothetical protein